MINTIPIVGWIISLVGYASMAVPFWICWTGYGLGRTYFYFLPGRYHDIPFWHCVGLFIIVSVLKNMVPKLASVNTDVECKCKS
jgi:hypothetical protein